MTRKQFAALEAAVFAGNMTCDRCPATAVALMADTPLCKPDFITRLNEVRALTDANAAAWRK